MREKSKEYLSNCGESSSVASENSETSSQLLKLISSDGWSSISSQNNYYDCDMELDELQSSNLRRNDSPEQSFQFDDVARISQIESDELLARQLQEQYNEEVAGAISTNEIDANISGSLQANISGSLQETDSHLTPTERSDQSNNREDPMSDLFGYYTQLAARNYSSSSSSHSQQQASNARRSLQSSEIDLERKLVAEIRNFTTMDSEKKRDFLESLEAAFNQSNSAFEDFNNEDEYEILTALDKKAAATENQIDSLPQSTIKVGDVKEMCSICLEVPSFGDKIRHLPCLHKFHLQCIDVWLSRKACCPVCKSKIS